MASSANITVVSTANTFDHWRIQTNLLVNDTNEVARGDFTKPTGNVTVTEGTLTLSNTSKTVLLDVKSGARIDGQLSVDTIVSDDDGDVYLNSGDIVLFNRATNALFQVNTNTRIDSVFVGITNAASGVINVNTRNVIVNTANTLFQNNSVLSTLNFDVYNTFFFGTNVNFTNTSAGSINVDNRLVLVNTPNVIFANTHSSARFNVFPSAFFHGGTVNIANISSTATVEVSPNSFFLKNVTISGTEDVTSDFRVNTNKFTVTASTGDTLVAGDLTVSGGDIVSTAVANIANVTTTTLNLGGAATTVEIGAATGTTNINNNLDVDGDVNIDGGDLTVSTSAFNLANTTATTVNLGGAATTLNMGALTGTTNVRNNLNVTGDLDVDGGDITSTATANIVNVTSTTVNFAGAATTLNMGASSGTTDVKNNLNVTGDLDVDGGDITGPSTFNLGNTSATQINLGGAAATVNVGSTTGIVNVRNDLVVLNDLTVSGGDIVGPATFNLANTSATQINLGGGAATVNVGSATGKVNVRNDLLVAGRVGISSQAPNSNLTVVGNVWATTGINAATLNVTTANITSTIGGSSTLTVQPNVSLQQGLTVSGNVTVTGNLFVEGDMTTLNVATLSIEDNEIILNSSVTGSPSLNASILIERGTSTDTFLRWSEDGDRWGWSDNGTVFYTFDNLRSALVTTNTTFGTVNTTFATFNTTFATVNTTFGTVNTNMTAANSAIAASNSAHGAANSAHSTSNSNMTAANSAIAASNSAHGAANSAHGTSNSNMTAANSAIAASNSAHGTTNTTFGTVNTTFATLNTSAATQNTAINEAGNLVAIYANNTLGMANANINFNNTATINVAVSANATNKRANVDLTVNANAIVQLGTLTGLNVSGISNISTIRSNDLRIDSNSSYFILNGNASFNNLDVRGNLVISGTSTNDTDTLVLRAAAGSDGDGIFRVKRGSTGIGNAEIRFFAASNVWQMTPNANAAPSYYTVITTQNVVDSVSSTSTTDAAAPNSVKTAYDQATNARNQANTARSDANSTFATINTTFSTLNTTTATMNTATSNRLLKAGDTMTGNLIMSGATINAATANISTIITGNALSLSTGTGSNSNVTVSANGTEYIRLTNVGRVGIGTTTPNSNLTIVGNVWATTGVNAATLNVATANITSTIGGGATLSVQPNVSLSQSLTVSGNVTVTGNLFVEGDTTTFNVATLSVEDNEIILNSSTAGVPSLDASIRIDRGTSTDTFLRWSEAGDRWGWSDDGTTFYTFDNVRSGLATSNSNMGAVNSAIGASNSAHGAANSAIGASNSAHGTTNTTFGTVNTAITNAHNQANSARDQANTAYGQANAARSDANTTFATLNTSAGTQNTWINNLNTATGTINSHLGTINTTFGTVNTTFATLNTSAASQNTSIASAANSVRVSLNSASTINAAAGLNFLNTASIFAFVEAGVNGNANVYFTTTGASAGDAYNTANASANLVAVYANNTLGMANANLNFNNTATINVSVSANATNKRANIEFTANGTALGIPVINTTFGTINTTFATVNATFSGNVTGTFTGYRERVNTATITGSTFTCDLSGNNVFDLTLQAPTVAITLTNVATSGFSRPATLILRQPSTSANVVTFANTINWSNAEVPVLASGIANKLDMITIVSVGGAIFFGSHAMANVSY